MRQRAPRVLIAANASGVGKTTVVCGLLRALKRRGLVCSAAKCGPDYIDPMFHERALGVPSRNLDLFLSSADDVVSLVAAGARDADITVMEGAMGFYDGIAFGTRASAWDVARVTETPVLLIVDGRGRARSLAAEVLGFTRMRDPSQIAGVVVNRLSPALYPQVKDAVEGECGIPVLGFLPPVEDCELKSRHLGLVLAGEVEGLNHKLDVLGAAVEEHVDLDALISLAQGARDMPFEPHVVTPVVTRPPRVAVAHDEAFCFYYRDALRLLEQLGAELVCFSPLRDEALPTGCAGLYLGGGYPELHAAELSANVSMRASVSRALGEGMPTIAECGGFMYLHEALEDQRGVAHPMVGAIAGTAHKTGHLNRFGYVTLTAKGDNLLCPAGGTLRAHEFHYWDSDDAGDAFHAAKPLSKRSWECAYATLSLYAGYPHIDLYSEPAAAARFVRACARWDGGGDRG